MSEADLVDFQLLREAMAASRDKGLEHAKPLLAEYGKRREAKAKAKAANDVM